MPLVSGEAASQPYIVSDDQVKAHLNKPNMSTDDLLEVQDMIAAAEEFIVSRCGDIHSATVTETHDGGREEIALDRDPVQSVTSVTFVVDDSTAVEASDVEVDEDAGIIWRTSGADFPTGRLRIVYVVGRAEVPSSLIEACLIIVKQLWETQRGHGGARPGLFGEGSEAGGGESAASAGYIFRGYAIPHRAAELLAHHIRPAIA